MVKKLVKRYSFFKICRVANESFLNTFFKREIKKCMAVRLYVLSIFLMVFHGVIFSMEQQECSSVGQSIEHKRRVGQLLQQHITQSLQSVSVGMSESFINIPRQQDMGNRRIEELFAAAHRFNDIRMWQLLGRLLYPDCMRQMVIQNMVAFVARHEELQKNVIGAYMQKYPQLYGNLRLSLVRKSGKNPILFSPEDQKIAYGAPNDCFRFLHILTNEESHPFYCYNDDDHDGDDDYCFELSHDCSVLATAGKRGNRYVVTLWDVYTGTVIKQLLQHPKGINSITFSPDDKTIAIACEDNGIRVFDRESGEKKYAVKALHIAFHPNNVFVAIVACDGSIQLLDTQKKIALFFDCPAVGYLQFDAILFSPDGNVLAAIDRQRNSIQLWDVLSGQKMNSLVGHALSVCSIAFSPNSALLLSGSKDGSIRLWDVRQGKQVYYILHNHQIRFVNFNHSGSQIVAEGEGSIYLYGHVSLYDVLHVPLSSAVMVAASTPGLSDQGVAITPVNVASAARS